MVDSIGEGRGVQENLAGRGFKTWEYKGSFNAPDRGRFLNLRAWSFWRLKDLLANGEIALPPDEELFDELLSIDWKDTGDDRVQILPKDDLRSKLGRSPDRADAVVMSLAAEARPVGRVIAFPWG